MGLYQKSVKASSLRGCFHTDPDHGETYQGTGNYTTFSSVHLNNTRKHKTGSPFLDKAEKGLPRISIGGGCWLYNYIPPSQQLQSIKEIVWFIFYSTNYVIIHNIKSVPPDSVYHRFPETFICLLFLKRTLNHQSSFTSNVEAA